MSGLDPRSFFVDCINPDQEAWKGINRSNFLGYKQRVPKKGDDHPSLTSVVKQVSKIAVSTFKQDDQRWVVLRAGEIFVATGPDYENKSQDSHKLEALINLRGTVIANVSEPDIHKFKITEQHGTVHTFKVASLSELHEWLTDLEVVHKGVHFPVPPPLKLNISLDGIKIINPGSGRTTGHYAFASVKKFSPVSERTVLIVVQTGATKDDVTELYFRSQEGRAREIVSLITDFVKALIEQKEAARTKGGSSTSSGGDSSRHRHRRRKHRRSQRLDAAGIMAGEDAAADDSSGAPARPAPRAPGGGGGDDDSFSDDSRSGRGGSRSRRKHYSFSSSGSRSPSPTAAGGKQKRRDDDNSSPARSDSQSDLPPLHPLWKEARAPNGSVYYYHIETKETSWSRDIAVKGGE